MTEVPRTEISYVVQSPSTPYSVQMNPELIGELLHEFGSRNEQISKLKITVNTRPVKFGHGGGYGVFSLIDKNIDMFTEPMWEEYLAKLHHIERNNDTTTKAEITDELNLKANSYLLHELKHAMDFHKYGAKYFIGMGMLTFLGLQAVGQGFVYAISSLAYDLGPSGETPYQIPKYVPLIAVAAGTLVSLIYADIFDPTEIRARNFEIEQKMNPKWSGLIKITPKKPEDTPLGRLAASGYRWKAGLD